LKKMVLALTAAVAILGHAATSHASAMPLFDDSQDPGTYSMPGLDVWVDGAKYTLSGTRTVTAIGYDYNYSGTAGGADVYMWGKVDLDPSLLFGFGVTNNTGSDVTFTFDQSLVIATDTYNHAYSTFSASSTDGNNDGVSATPIGSKIVQSSINAGATNLGVDIGDACVDPAGNPVSQVYNFADVNNSFAPTLASELDQHIAFKLSQHDAFTANGRTDLTASSVTPEPNTLMFLGGGLLTFLASRRRKGAK
jgi:hypothetical protein